jgi:hypothetical protein
MQFFAICFLKTLKWSYALDVKKQCAGTQKIFFDRETVIGVFELRETVSPATRIGRWRGRVGGPRGLLNFKPSFLYISILISKHGAGWQAGWPSLSLTLKLNTVLLKKG